MLKALFVLETFRFLLCETCPNTEFFLVRSISPYSVRIWDISRSVFGLAFCLIEKKLDKEAMVNFKLYDVIDCTTNDYNTYIVQYL